MTSTHCVLLAVALLFCSALGDVVSYNYGRFDATNKNDFQFNLDAAGNNNPPPGYLLLTQNKGNSAGTIFLKNSISLQGPNGFKASFSTKFSFRMSNGGGSDGSGNGADGIMFAVTSASNSGGSYGGGIGYQGITSSVAIEFDTWNNAELGDIDGNHIGINTNGNIRSLQQVSYANLFNNGATYYSWIDFNGDTQLLEVRISTTNVRPAASIISRVIDLVSILGTPNVYVGFTAATGGAYENHIIDTWSFTNQYAPNAVCGNGLIELGESCDGGNCCTSTCTFATSAVTCRASTGVCDAAETCSGSSSSCPADSFTSSSVTCRASTGPCDTAETCTGNSVTCPADSFAASSVTCRASSGPCDVAETCTGTTSSCPADTFSSSSVVCRASAGACDVAETCSGSSSSCPADAFATSAVTCRAAIGTCDVAETCSGSSSSCPADAFATSATVCRASTGVCDVAESCSGTSGSCPTNSFAPSTTVCRQSIGSCDPAETCSGTSGACSSDVSGYFETACAGLDFSLAGSTYSFLDFDVISFNGFVANTGDIEGRAAFRHNAQVGSGWSVGYQIKPQSSDRHLPYSLVVGDDLTFPSGAVYPDGSGSPYAGQKEGIFVGKSFTGAQYLSDSVTGTCQSTGCMDSQFEAARQCYGRIQSQISNNADNVASVIQWSGLSVTCNSATDSTYYLTLTPQQMSQYTYVMFNGCNNNARWVITIAGNDAVTFTGASFPVASGAAIFNILGSGRTVNVHDINLVGNILAPFNNIHQTSGVITGKVISNDITMSLQMNRAQCFTPQ